MLPCQINSEWKQNGGSFRVLYDLINFSSCNTTKPPGLLNILAIKTPTGQNTNTWLIHFANAQGEIVDALTFVQFDTRRDPLRDLTTVVTSIESIPSSVYNTFLNTAESYTSYSTQPVSSGCVAFENYYRGTDGNPILSEYVIQIDVGTDLFSRIFWRLTPFAELGYNALVKFANRNLPPPPIAGPITFSLSQSVLPTTVPNPSARITAIYQDTPDGSNILSITYSIFDVYAYELVGSRLSIVPDLPMIGTYQTIIVVNNSDLAFFGPELWAPGCTLQQQLATLANYSCTTFTEVNLIAYALAKYVLAAIMYGEFNTKYLAQSFNYQFMLDLSVSRFAVFVELFTDPTYEIVGFNAYFK